MSDLINVSICDGKYTIVQDASGRTKLLRYGEPWRWVTGDNVILGAAYEIEKLQERIKQLEDNRTIAAANSLANMMAYEDAIAKIKRLEGIGKWIPANAKPEGYERKVLLWIVWPSFGAWCDSPEPLIGWWKHGPKCFALGDIENADHLVRYWMELTDPTEAKEAKP